MQINTPRQIKTPLYRRIDGGVELDGRHMYLLVILSAAMNLINHAIPSARLTKRIRFFAIGQDNSF